MARLEPKRSLKSQSKTKMRRRSSFTCAMLTAQNRIKRSLLRFSENDDDNQPISTHLASKGFFICRWGGRS